MLPRGIIGGCEQFRGTRFGRIDGVDVALYVLPTVFVDMQQAHEGATAATKGHAQHSAERHGHAGEGLNGVGHDGRVDVGQGYGGEACYEYAGGSQDGQRVMGCEQCLTPLHGDPLPGHGLLGRGRCRPIVPVVLRERHSADNVLPLHRRTLS